MLDTETTTDPSQRLVFGSARLYRLRRRTSGVSMDLRQEWLFYADELPESDPDGYAALASYAARNSVQLSGRAEFLEKVFFPLAVKGEFPIVGFNLPFDLSRLAVGWAESRKTKGRGFSLRLWGRFEESGRWDDHPYRPRIIIEKIAPGRAFMRLTRTKDAPLPTFADGGKPQRSYGFPGHFLDLQTLTFALTNTRHSLESACRSFGASIGKGHTTEHGQITDSYIDYNRRDVEATAALLARLVEEYERHPIGLPITKAMSPATIGKAYLKGMGIVPPLQKWPDTSEELLGLSMAAYFGGRAECRIRHVPVPVVTVDFLSMYPTVNALMGLWWYLIAERIDTVDSTDKVRDLLARVAVEGTEAVLDPAMWKQLVGYVLIQPEGDILPVRANYGDRDDDRPQIGINPAWSDRPLWYPIADAVASTVLTGRPPQIIRAVSLQPVGVQPELQPVRFRDAIEIRPAEQDFFKAIIEERKRVAHRTDLDVAEKARLDSGLKTLANSTSYGIFAEMIQKQSEPAQVRVVGLEDPFVTTVDHPEDPGEFCYPPLGACVPAGARLMLATLEKLIRDNGGHYALCDTDAMAIVATPNGGLVSCPGGEHRTTKGQPAIVALSWQQVDQIRALFQRLNPYDSEAVPDHLLELEKENFDSSGARVQLLCVSTSAKRYALYRLQDSALEILKPSEHGLGHLLSPTQPPIEWIEDAWKIVISRLTGAASPQPDWLDQPAVAQLVATTPYLLQHFRHHNNQKDYPDQVKPFGFLLSVTPRRVAGILSQTERLHLIAPYEKDATKWLGMEWTDIYSGKRHRISTTINPADASVIPVKTLRMAIEEWATNPEPKSLGHDGQPCGKASPGLLARRPVRVSGALIAYIGKESNRLDEAQTGLRTDIDDILNHYADPARDPWVRLVIPAIQHIGPSQVAKKAGLDRRTVERIVRGAVPHADARARILAALEALIGRGADRRRLRERDLAIFLETIAPRACVNCGVSLEGRRRLTKFCDDRCRVALRRRQS